MKKTGQPFQIALPNLTLNYVQINALALYVSWRPKPLESFWMFKVSKQIEFSKQFR